jgi:hypothetical protein
MWTLGYGDYEDRTPTHGYTPKGGLGLAKRLTLSRRCSVSSIWLDSQKPPPFEQGASALSGKVTRW